MKLTEIKIKKLKDNAVIPRYATKGSAAVDLHTTNTGPVTLYPGQSYMFQTGIAVWISNPFLVGIIVPRSGLGSKFGIQLRNTVGVIDSDYQGEIGACLYNSSSAPYTVLPGDRVCQMLFMPVAQAVFSQVSDFAETTERGTGGFGSTGVGESEKRSGKRRPNALRFMVAV